VPYVKFKLYSDSVVALNGCKTTSYSEFKVVKLLQSFWKKRKQIATLLKD